MLSQPTVTWTSEGRLLISLAVRASSRTLRTSSRRGEEVVPVFFDVTDVAGHDVGDFGEEREVDAGFAVCEFGEKLPDLFGGEAEDWGDEASESFGDAPECGLSAAAGGVIGGEGVEAVLEDVEVERAEVGVYVLVEGLVGAVELEVFVGLADFGVELGGAGEDELV